MIATRIGLGPREFGSPIGNSEQRRVCRSVQSWETRPNRVGDVVRREMRVMLLGHSGVRMAKVGRYHLQWRAGRYQVGSIGVAEHVKRSRWRDMRGPAGVSEWSLRMRFPPPLAVRALKHQGIARFSHCEPTKKDDPVIGQNDVTRLPALGGSDGDRAGFALEIVHALVPGPPLA